MLIPQDVTLNSRRILRTLDGRVVVRPLIDVHTAVLSGDNVYTLNQLGVDQWNRGEELTGDGVQLAISRRLTLLAEF